jgi:hypothetical protein
MKNLVDRCMGRRATPNSTVAALEVASPATVTTDPRERSFDEQRMLMSVIQHQPHCAGTDLRRELVACLLADAQELEPSANPGKRFITLREVQPPWPWPPNAKSHA